MRNKFCSTGDIACLVLELADDSVEILLKPLLYVRETNMLSACLLGDLETQDTALS